MKKANAAIAAQMLDLEANATDRGMVMLSDVLFTTGKSDLKPGAMERLNKLESFMLKYPDCSLVIKDHTDSTGSPVHRRST